MKRYAYVSLVLGGIALICAVLIALMNMLTSPIIDKNDEAKINDTYTKIYSDYYKNEEVNFVCDDKGYIKSKVIAYDKNNKVLGYIYTTSGKNAYGEISLMIGVSNYQVVDVEFLVNSESFASTVNSHVKANYPSKEEAVIILDPYDKSEFIDVDSLSIDDVDTIDTKCGATFGATLVKNMIKSVLDEAKEAKV